MSGLVYDAQTGPTKPIPGAVVSIVMCGPRVFQAVTGPDGHYTLILPDEYLNLCVAVTLRCWAAGYLGAEGVIAVTNLRAQPVRDIGLEPSGLPTPTDTLRQVARNLLPVVLRRAGDEQEQPGQQCRRLRPLPSHHAPVNFRRVLKVPRRPSEWRRP